MDTINEHFESLTLQRYNPGSDILFVIGPTGCGKSSFIDECVLPRIERADVVTRRAAEFEVSPYQLTSNGCLDLLLAIETAEKERCVFVAEDLGMVGFHDRSESVSPELAHQLTDLRPTAYLPLQEKVRDNMIRMMAAMTRNAARSRCGLVITLQHLCSMNQVLHLVEDDFADRLKVVNWIPPVERRKPPSSRFRDNLLRTLSLGSSVRARAGQAR